MLNLFNNRISLIARKVNGLALFLLFLLLNGLLKVLLGDLNPLIILSAGDILLLLLGLEDIDPVILTTW